MPIFLIQLSLYISIIFSPEFLLLIALFAISVSFIYLNIKRIHYRELLSVNCPNSIKGVVIICISTIVALLLSQSVKYIFKIPRPLHSLVTETGYGFPSGHASVAFAICAVTIFLLFKYFRDMRSYINYLHVALFSFTAMLIAFSRVVLGVHRWVDIVVGGVIGLCSAYIAVTIYYTLIKYIDKKFYI
jgi:undecaprenyl-diphosphatase